LISIFLRSSIYLSPYKLKEVLMIIVSYKKLPVIK
jgi:hypothetical protein